MPVTVFTILCNLSVATFLQFVQESQLPWHPYYWWQEQKGKRFALKHSRVMIHQPLGGTQGQASDIEIAAREIIKVKKELYTIISNHSGKPFEEVEKDSDRDYWMTSEEAKAYGMIDDVLVRK